MPSESGTGHSPRTWTDNEQPKHYKWLVVFWLSVTFSVLLVLFVLILWPRTAERTFLTSIAVADYGQRLTPPHYAVWEPDQVSERMNGRGLFAWVPLPAQRLESADQLVTALERLGAALASQDMTARDTLVVQLRGHAIVTEDDRGLVLLAGESEQNKQSQVGKLPMVKLLSMIQELPARNIVILADICDLDYAPQYGLAINPVPTALGAICGKLKNKAGQQLWIVCSKAEFQTAHVSHLRQRTLLQSACEFALEVDSNDSQNSRNSDISLAEFYDRVVRYAHAATDGEQTPLLMRAGDTEHYLTNISDKQADSPWKSAQLVKIARVDNTRASPDTKKDGTTSDASPGDTSSPAQSDPKNSGDSAGKAALDPSSNSDKSNGQPGDVASNSNTSDASKADAPAKEDVLRYWQLRDQLQSAEFRWSPNQFAPHLWRQHQKRFLRLQFVGDDNSSAKNELVRELEALKLALGGSDPKASYPLVRAYEQFQQDATINRQPWEDDSILPRSEQTRWKELRDQYRTYADSCAELPEWAEWSRDQLEELDNLEDLAKSVLESNKNLATDKSALESHASLAFDARPISKATGVLRRELEQERLSAQEVFMRHSVIQLSWGDERRIQKLLETPLIDARGRQELWKQYRKLNASHLKEPEHSSVQIDRSPLEQLVKIGNYQPRLPVWFAITNRLLALVSDRSLPQPSGMKDMVAWGSLFSKAVDEAQALQPSASEQRQRLQRWHVGCLQPLCTLETVMPAETLSGIVVPATLSRGLVAELAVGQSLAFSSETQLPLSITVQRKDGSTLNTCKFSWRLIEPKLPAGSSLTPADCLTIYLGDLLLTSTPKEVPISNKTLRLVCRTNVESQELNGAIKAELQLSESGSNDIQRLAVELRPRQPDTIELTALQMLGKTAKPVIAPGKNAPLVLSAIAMTGASSQYEFSLVNLSSVAKQCKVNVYALPADGSGDKREVDARLQNAVDGGLRPMFVSEAVALEPALINRTTPARLFLKPFVEDAAEASAKLSVIKEPCWLCFEMQELDSEGKAITKTSTAVCSLRGDSPATPSVLSIEPVLPVKGAGFQLRLEPLAAAWEAYGHKDLSVKIEATDDFGVPIDVDARLPLFSPDVSDSTVVDIRPDPTKPKPKSLIAHLTIGGYPRAIAYSLTDGVPQRYPSAFAWFDSIEAIADGASEPIGPRIRPEQWIFPTKEEEQRLTDTQRAFGALSIKARIDLPPHCKGTVMRLISVDDKVDDAPRKHFNFDRQMQFKLEGKNNGLLSVSAQATDIQCEMKAELDGRVQLQLEFIDSGGEPIGNVTTSQILVFDQQPPVDVEIDASSRFLIEGETVKLTMQPSDKLSGIEKVEMAIDGPGAEEGVFDPGDKLLLAGAEQANRAWAFNLTTEDLQKSGRESVKIVAMSVDWARNEQRRHPPVNVTLKKTAKKPAPNK